FDARLQVLAPARGPLRVRGPLTLRGGAFDTPDGTIAGQNLVARLDLDLAFDAQDTARVAGTLQGGELLFGNAYLAPQGPVRVEVQAEGRDG
ncbi:hypothetical protein ABTJ04_19230, partial [Acinetobacter baumannii]